MRAERCFLPVMMVLLMSGCGVRGERVCLRQACYALEVAKTDEARTRGLMFRKGLPAGQAMLFEFGREDYYPFWMKNMSFPIDILWLDTAKRVVHIAADVPPCRTDVCPVYTPAARAAYVLEIPAGDAVRYGIIAGDILR